MEKGGVPAAHESIEAFPNSIDPESFILIETLHGHQPIALDALSLSYSSIAKICFLPS